VKLKQIDWVISHNN